ncbi:MAG TPA: translation elongation factor Ts [Gemmatimonadales bacterium]|nr:translation elongation factor Ts [Gemmatimonadales bacterium]
MTTKTITTKDISELRARTGAGIGDCKKALEEAGGDMEAAAELLRKKGIAKAEKRAGRDAMQGLVFLEASEEGDFGAMVELNCETDFVAKTEAFQALGLELLAFAAAAPAGVHRLGVDGELLAAPIGGQAAGERIKEVAGVIGEAISAKRLAHFRPHGGTVGAYLHHNRQVGVLVEVAGATGAAALTMARDVALHVASADPVAVRTEDIPAEVMERERRIAEEQVAAEGKPEAIRAKIVQGKLKKFAEERALLAQPFVKDEARTVAEVVQAVPGAMVVRFARFRIGEA